MIELSSDDLPLLGETAAIELANTWYGEGEEHFDFLGEDDLALLWVQQAGKEQLFAEPSRRTAAAGLPELRRLRDSIWKVANAVVGSGQIRAADINRINAAARLGFSQLQLTLPASGQRTRLVKERETNGKGIEPVLRILAESAIELFASEHATKIQRCSAPDCTMLYVKRHHLRRFCHPSCGHRSRQARYYRRQRKLNARRLRSSSS